LDKGIHRKIDSITNHKIGKYKKKYPVSQLLEDGLLILKVEGKHSNLHLWISIFRVLTSAIDRGCKVGSTQDSLFNYYKKSVILRNQSIKNQKSSQNLKQTLTADKHNKERVHQSVKVTSKSSIRKGSTIGLIKREEEDKCLDLPNIDIPTFVPLEGDFSVGFGQ